ncbi:hypothetical protein EVAR_10561_1 [Eumeta japonica]|uniref:Uncharacterized protein n=1 Tax=Eumeta variegata TaxID=151549 RepID=A0A4C1ZJR3_EUMVA|nr:hypothetical protein EVAR_10561_1 [Eumeta japonica]
MATFQLIIRPWLPYSIKVLVKTNQTSPNSMGLRRLRSSYGHLPAPSSDADYHIVSKYSSRRIKRAQTRWAPSSDADHIVSKYCQEESNELDGLRRLITEFLWPPSSSIIRPWLPYSISRTRQDESNEPKLDGVVSFNYGVPMATFSSIIRR